MKIVGKIFVILFCIVYFFGLSLLVTASFATNLLSGNYYTDILKSVDLDKIKVSEFESVFEGSEFSKDITLEAALVQTLTKSGVEERIATAIIENKEIREVIGNFIGDYINYKAGTGEKPIIDRKDVETILNNPDVIKTVGQKPTSEDIDKIYDQLNELIKEIVEEGGTKYDNTKRDNNINENF